MGSSDSHDIKTEVKILSERARMEQVRARLIRSRSTALQERLGRRRPSPRLSQREAQALALLSSGVTTKEIAIHLGISVSTANYHLSNVYRKLGTHNRVGAANAYFASQREAGRQAPPPIS